MKSFIISMTFSWLLPVALFAQKDALDSLPSVTLQPPNGVYADGKAVGLEFSSDGQTLAVAGYYGTIELWNWQTCRFQHLFKSGTTEGPIAISPDGSSVAFVKSGSHCYVGIWNIAGKRDTTNEIESADARQKFYHSGNIYSLAFDPAGELLASGGRDRTVRLWLAADGKPKDYVAGIGTASGGQRGPMIYDTSVLDVGFAPNGRAAGIVRQDGGALLRTSPRNRWNDTAVPGANQMSPAGLAFSADSRYLLIFGGPPAPTSTSNSRRQAGLRGGRPGTPTARPSGGRLLLASATRGRSMAMITLPESVRCAAFSPDGKLVAAGDWSNDTHLIDVAERKIVKTLPDSGGRAVAFSPDGKVLATGGEGGPAKLWYFDVAARPEKMPDYQYEAKLAKSQSILQDAKRLIARNKAGQAIGRIHSILDNYSDTPAAAEVPALLTQIIKTRPNSQAAKYARAIQSSLNKKKRRK